MSDQAEPIRAEGVVQDEAREIGLLYNYRADDSLQFTRWNMFVALRYGRGAAGWIVGSGDGKRWRTWTDGMSDWTDDRDNATRYARRADAEAVHREDEDAWTVEPYGATPTAAPAPNVQACTASPDHADILETIENAADDWQTKGYPSALAEVRDMANVGRALMEALPEGYSYMDSPAEIVSDLQNERDEALANAPNVQALVEALQRAVSDCQLAQDALGNSSEQFDSVRRGFGIIKDRLSAAIQAPAGEGVA